MWIDNINIENFDRWLSLRVSQIPSGNKDPYTSSMRSSVRFVSALKGTAESRKSQLISDLASAQLYDRESNEISSLGNAFLQKCNLLNIPDGKELPLILLLLLEALKRNNVFYKNIIRFWYKVSKQISFLQLIQNVKVSYLISYLSVPNSADSYTPLNEIVKNDEFKNITDVNVSELQNLALSENGRKVVEKLVETISSYATRSARSDMFRALNLIFSFDKSAVIDEYYSHGTEENDQLRNIIALYVGEFSLGKALYEENFCLKGVHGVLTLCEKNPQIIYFGAPGTGKSYQVNEISKLFDSQQDLYKNDESLIKAAVADSILKPGKLTLLNALGFKYSDKLKNIAKKDLPSFCGYDRINELYVGAAAKVIASRMVVAEKDLSDLDAIKDWLKDDKRGDCDILKWTNAIGYKFGDFLKDWTLKEIKTEFGFSDAQKWWMYRGAQASQIEPSEKDVKIKYVERVTFHPNYSYAQFVGTYKPVQDEDDPQKIIYSYVPGPFMRTYVRAQRALQNKTDEHFLLIIEEINRANVAAVFGDVFQLLDRDSNGVSVYPVAASEDIKRYLSDNGITDCNELKIPSNMFIWATMNSADQGVFPMDTAFKRRWEFEYIGVNEGDGKLYYDEEKKNPIKVPVPHKDENDETKTVYVDKAWDSLRKEINKKLLKELKVNEDKLMGPFFINLDILKNACKDDESRKNFVKSFKSKVLMYLFEDVAKMNPGKLFSGCGERPIYSEVCEKFDEIGEKIFGFEI